MTVKEFWEKIDAIDVDSRDDSKYTEDEMYDIGCEFIKLNNSEKREIGGWDKLVEILQPLDKNGNIMTKGDTFRQWIKGRRYAKDEMVHNEHMLSGKTIDDISFAEFEEKTIKMKQDLYIQQTKTRDEHNAYRKTLRDEARIEEIKDLIKDSIAKIPELPKIESDCDALAAGEAVLLFGDLHIGAQIDNFYNKYNVEVAKKRVNKLVHDTIEYCRVHNIHTLHFVNLGDLIAGSIHISARLVQEIDVVEQVMTASEIVANALNELSVAIPEVVYRDCLDNHSRCTANLHEHIEKENFGKLIRFYLEARLKDTSVIFAEDNLDDNIGVIYLDNGKKIVFAHGHQDNINSVVQAYTAATKEYVDYIALGHYHSTKMKTFMNSKVFVNGSVVGTEDYAMSKRLFGTPEQTLLVFEGNNLVNITVDLNVD